ncbi:MAG: hypothetical protein WCF90_01585 [Methanomicrobiales archaeon]
MQKRCIHRTAHQCEAVISGVCCQPVTTSWTRLATKIYPHLNSQRGFPPPPIEKAVPEWTLVIPLPRPEDITASPIDCRKAIEGRRSIRHYTRDPLTIDELAFLFWTPQEIVEVKAP